MCGMAVLRIGGGLVTVATPGAVLPAVAGFAPEMMTEPLGDAGSHGVAAAHASRLLELAKSRDVLAIGPGKLLDNGQRGKLSVAVGDQVIYGKYTGSEIEVDGREVKIVRESDILAKVVK